MGPASPARTSSRRPPTSRGRGRIAGARRCSLLQKSCTARFPQPARDRLWRAGVLSGYLDAWSPADARERAVSVGKLRQKLGRRLDWVTPAPVIADAFVA